VIIDRQVGKTRVDERVDYLLHGADGERDQNTVHILDGDPEFFVEIAKHNPYKTKTYNYLISFAESKGELERKLREKGKTIEDLYHEVISFLLPAEYYPRESLNVLAIAHSDTDNFHIHLTVENYDHLNQKSLYIPKNRTETDYYRALERYFKVKYGLSFGEPKARNKGKAGKEKVKEILLRRGTYKEKSRDEIKEELTNFLTDLILSGEIETREDLLAYLQTIDGISLNRVGKKYISLKIEGEKKPLRLKGGIYDEQHFTELKEYIRTNRREIPSLAEAGELLEKVRRKRESYIAKRRRKLNLERLESPDTERQLNATKQIEYLAEQPKSSKDTLVDRAFSLDWASAIRLATTPPPDVAKPERFSSSLPAESDNRPERAEVENVQQPTERDAMSGRQRELDRLSGDSYSYTAMKLREKAEMRKDINEVRRLELEYLKNLEPEVVFSALGITGWEEKNGYLLVRSPLREDNNPSFEVFYGTERSCWIYMDFGTGWRGTSIDLWQAVRGVDYITAVQEMREEFGINLLERENKDVRKLKQKIVERIQTEQKRQEEKRKRLAKEEKTELKKVTHRILEVRKPQHPALINYLKERGIKEVPEWLKEIRYFYLPKKKYYFALAVKDQNGVWHARNPYGKTNILTAPDQKPTFSYIKRGAGNKTLVVVEGLFDALTLNQEWKKNYDIVILNSTTNTERFIESGILKNYKQVILALDNDEAGLRAEKELKEYLEQLEDIKVGKLIYSVGKDINECYIKRGGLKLENITPKRFWIGRIQDGTEGGKPVYRAVITDNKRVLEKLGARDIERIYTDEHIELYWIDKECRGYVELYLSEKAPEWIYKGLNNAVWSKVVEYNYLPSEKVEYKPTEIHHRRYFETDTELILDKEIEEQPEKYAEHENREIRELARKRIEKLRKIEEDFERIRRMREQERGYSRGPGL